MSTSFRPVMREAIRRMLQVTMFVVPVSIVATRLWKVILFQHDEHPWLLIAALVVTAAVPVGIWWREATESREAKIFEVAASFAAAVVGSLLYLLFIAWIGFLLTDPYSGPMAMEATIYLFVVCGIAASASAFLMLAPLLLDASFFTQRFRTRAWKTVVVALPIVTTAALLIGPHLKRVFS